MSLRPLHEGVKGDPAASAHLSHILVASNPGARAAIVEALSQPAEWDLTFVDSVEEGLSLLQSQYVNLIFCTLQFDNSRLFDFLQSVRSNLRTAAIPFMAAKISKGVLSEAAVNTALQAAQFSGANGCVNLPEWRAQLGIDKADEKLRWEIEQLIRNNPLPISFRPL